MSEDAKAVGCMIGNVLQVIGGWRIRRAAEVAHEVNRAYCQALGDDSQVPWADAPDWQKESALEGVRAVARGLVRSPGDSHQGWLKHKQAEGWVWGPVKDPDKKQHPCMVPFKELPPEQRMKDHLFLGTVLAVLDAD